MISRLFCAILPLEFICKMTYNIFHLILFKSYNSISMIRFVSVFSLNLNGPREERRKMNYREFVYAVEKQLNQKMGGDAKVSVYSAVKNNSTERMGVLIEKPGINISPTIYLEEYFECYIDGKTLDQITEEIKRFYESIRREESWDYDQILQYEGVKDQIVFKLINTKENKEFLETVPNIPFLDLSIVFYVLLEAGSGGSAAMVVNNTHMSRWDTDVETLWKDAKLNVRRLLPAEFVTMNSALKGLVHVCVGENKRSKDNLLMETEPAEGKDFMYVLSNHIRNYGAACIAYPFIPDMIAHVLGEDYYILPSSIHELIIIPCSKGIGQDDMNSMIREINDTQVADEEVLSDHFYLYRKESGKITMG